MQKIHLKAPGNWINDPNGFIYYKGEYHLFYQYFPYEPRWGTMHWGHAVSPDLVTWEHRGIALFPSKHDDRNGCFSGSAVEHDGKLYLYYTGVRYLEEQPEDIHCCPPGQFVAAQMMLVSEDGVRFDNMNRKRTVILPIEDPAVGDKTDTRDPKVWRGKDAWYMVLGTRTPENKGKLLFYRSADLVNWEYVNGVPGTDYGEMWECPDYFALPGGEVLVFSPMGVMEDKLEYQNVAVCTLVEFREEDCTMKLSGNYQLLDLGVDLYAPQSTTDAEGRRVMVAWARMPETVEGGANDDGKSDPGVCHSGAWNGMFCIPRVVEVRNGHVCFDVHPNVAGQYVRRIAAPREADPAGYCVRLTMGEGDRLDIGGYVITCKDSCIRTDRSRVFRGHKEIRNTFSTPAIDGEISLEIYVDAHLIEIYINHGEYVLSNVVYDLGDEVRAECRCEPELYTLQ